MRASALGTRTSGVDRHRATCHVVALYGDRYARVIGLVSVKGVVVNEQLVRDGHARAYDRRLPTWLRARYKGFEQTDRDSGAGLWGSRVAPVPPWEWRRRKTGGCGRFVWLARLLRRHLRTAAEPISGGTS